MTVNTPFRVPTIDIGPYIRDPSSKKATTITNDIREACENIGFFQLVGHGIPRTLQDAAFKGSESLFALPLDEKKKLSRSKTAGAGAGGYEVMGIQGLEDGKLPDLSEVCPAPLQQTTIQVVLITLQSFYIARETQSHPTTEEGPNQWPANSLLGEEVFRKSLQQYYKQVFDLALVVFEILSRGLPYGSHIFDNFVSGDQVIASLRLLHYPPQETTDERQLGIGAHTDFGAITLLLQDDNPGLQILDSSTGQWVPVLPNRDAYVVNIGDMLEMWTKGLYKSGFHRVVNRSLKDRYSMPFFFDGELNCPLLPFDGSEPEGEVLTVKDHLDVKRTNAYKRGADK